VNECEYEKVIKWEREKVNVHTYLIIERGEIIHSNVEPTNPITKEKNKCTPTAGVK
jgi:hypothetical protein